MIEIFISTNNRKKVLKLPVIPEQFTVTSPFNHQTYSTIGQGDIKLIGLRGLKTIAWESFFPAHNYPFNRSSSYDAWEYVNALEVMREQRLPIRLIITGANINITAVIDEFSYGLKDGTGDIYYSISFSEFKLVQIKGV